MKIIKTIKIIMLFAVALCLISSCSKKDERELTEQEATEQEITQKAIMGKWKLVSEVTETTRPPNPPMVETDLEEEEYWDFRTKGKVVFINEGVENEEVLYAVIDKNTLQIDGGECTIKVLSNQKLVIEQTTQSSQKIIKRIFKLTR